MEKELILTYQPEKEDYIKASHTLAMNTTSFILVDPLCGYCLGCGVVCAGHWQRIMAQYGFCGSGDGRLFYCKLLVDHPLPAFQSL